jgi:hypothetical protein
MQFRLPPAPIGRTGIFNTTIITLCKNIYATKLSTPLRQGYGGAGRVVIPLLRGGSLTRRGGRIPSPLAFPSPFKRMERGWGEGIHLPPT